MKKFFFPVCDNDRAFFAFVNLVINNRHNDFKGDPTKRPERIGKVTNLYYTHNEVGELWIEVQSKKDLHFLEMIGTQFCLLRTYWENIDACVKYKEASKFDFNPEVEVFY